MILVLPKLLCNSYFKIFSFVFEEQEVRFVFFLLKFDDEVFLVVKLTVVMLNSNLRRTARLSLHTLRL